MPRRKTILPAQAGYPRLDDKRAFARFKVAAAAIKAPKKSASARPTSAKVPRERERGAATAASREQLLAQLLLANAKVEELEARLANVTDRIAWIADRLHSLLHQKDESQR